MQLHKKILLIALSMAFHGVAIGMYTNNNEILKSAGYITRYARIDNDPNHMYNLGAWLTAQRNNIPETEKWHDLIKKLASSVPRCACICQDNRHTRAVSDVVVKIAMQMQPGEDCSQLLADRAQEAIDKLAKNIY